MKKRQGFVSNSSSSSFIMRGFKIAVKDLVEKPLGVDKDSDDMYEDIYDALNKLGVELRIEEDRCYFSEDKAKDYVLGVEIGDSDDGCITEMSDAELKKEDDKIMKELAKIDIVPSELSTFFQYLSNDNY